MRSTERFYSVTRLRGLSEKRYLSEAADAKTFGSQCKPVFVSSKQRARGSSWALRPWRGIFFRPTPLAGLPVVHSATDVLLGCLRSLGLYRHPDSGQLIRVNYAALNVEEFGSVYEGLLEYEPKFIRVKAPNFSSDWLVASERSATGSHYTPDDLVQPLIRHSLDHLIAGVPQSQKPQSQALLDLRVADIACGSGPHLAGRCTADRD